MPGVAKDDEKLNRDLCQPGCKVFYWEPEHAWSIGVIDDDDGKKFVVSGEGYSATKKGALQKCTLTDEKVWPIREDVLDEDCDDLLNLTVLHDATIQRCLYVRYMRDVVYTFIGQIVVALNPWNFKIPHYVDAKMPDYLKEGETIRENLPHSWAQAHNTWHDLRRDAENQTILISGESGAGKTEAAKIVMKYLGSLSCIRGTEETKEMARKVAFNINQASPILEGFGNAKTVRNDNSSRFGKFMKVQFDADGVLVGAFTIKYLLEKSRIVTAALNERVYHSFYLLTKGKDAAAHSLRDASQYHCNAGKCIDIPKVDDGEDYSICLEAMANVGFAEDEIEGVWRVVAGVLHAQQVVFEAIDEDSCAVAPASAQLVGTACGEWQVDAESFAKELVTTTMSTRDGDVTKKLTVVKAVDGRDALSKAVYDALFGWQVERINRKTDSGTGENFIGLLDIFGFEDFEYNSFEQICINLANETLQNHYNTFIFTKDMEECRAEGIDVREVKCPDNAPCLKMMTDKTGIFGLLDDECSMGKGSDAGFLSKVIDTHSKNPFFAQKKLAKDSFVVHHYAASVNYSVENWLDKNRDTLKPAVKLLMRDSSHGLIKTLLPEPDADAKKVTVGGYFKEQLQLLMALINSTAPHWIRCVKPHPAKKPLMVDGITMMTQLESSGVLGTVKIRKAGFPVRPTFKKFVARFKVCAAGPYPSMSSDNAVLSQFSSKILESVGLDRMKAQVGKTRVFMKNESNQEMEAARERALRSHILCLKRCAYGMVSSLVVRRRGWVAAARHVQAEVRVWMERTAEVRADLRRQRQEAARAWQALLSRLSADETLGRSEIEDEERDGMMGIRSAFVHESRVWEDKHERDEQDRKELMAVVRREREAMFERQLPFYARTRAEMIDVLLEACGILEVAKRKRIPPQQEREWQRILDLAERDRVGASLATMHRTERSVRMLLAKLEYLQREESIRRRELLPEHEASLDAVAEPWVEPLGAVRFWAAHMKRRRRRLEDKRGLNQELQRFDQLATRTVPRPVHRDPATDKAKESATKRAWRGCTGVPDADQLTPAADRPQRRRPPVQGAAPPALDGSSGDPRRDASPRRRSRSGARGLSPGRRGLLLAKTPVAPDHSAAQLRSAQQRGALLGDLGRLSQAQFLNLRAQTVGCFLELRDAGRYEYNGRWANQDHILSEKDLRKAQDNLHDARAAYCDELRRYLVQYRNHCRRFRVLEQSSVTGQWSPLTPADWSLAHFSDTPDWKDLKREKDRLEYAIQNHRDAMAALLRAAAAAGVTTLVDPRSDTPYNEVRRGYDHLVRAVAPDVRGSDPEIFTLLLRRYMPAEEKVRVVSPKAGPLRPRTPRAHIASVSPRRARSPP